MNSKSSKSVLALIAAAFIVIAAGCATAPDDVIDFEMPIDGGTGGDGGSGGSGGDGGSSGE